jgi:hypothetical protein
MRITPSISVVAFAAMIAFASISFAQAPATSAPAKPRPTATATRRTPAAAPATKAVETPKPIKHFTNEDVLALKTNGLSDDEMVAVINQASNKLFDFSGEATTALVSNGISKKVRSAMLGIEYVPDPPPAPVAAAPATASAPVANVAPEKEKKGRFSFITKRIPGRGGDDEEGNEDEVGTSGASIAKPKKLKDGEPYVIQTPLSSKSVETKIQEYLKSQLFPDIELTSTGVKTNWNSEHKCEGFTAARCWERADVTITAKNGETVVEVLISEKRRNSGSANSGSDKGPQGKPTAKLGAELEALLSPTTSVGTK